MNFQTKLTQKKYGGQFQRDKTLSKVRLLYLEGKLQQASYH